MLPEQNKEEEEEKGKVVGEGGEERKSDWNNEAGIQPHKHQELIQSRTLSNELCEC